MQDQSFKSFIKEVYQIPQSSLSIYFTKIKQLVGPVPSEHLTWAESVKPQIQSESHDQLIAEIIESCKTEPWMTVLTKVQAIKEVLKVQPYDYSGYKAFFDEFAKQLQKCEQKGAKRLLCAMTTKKFAVMEVSPLNIEYNYSLVYIERFLTCFKAFERASLYGDEIKDEHIASLWKPIHRIFLSSKKILMTGKRNLAQKFYVTLQHRDKWENTVISIRYCVNFKQRLASNEIFYGERDAVLICLGLLSEYVQDEDTSFRIFRNDFLKNFLPFISFC